MGMICRRVLGLRVLWMQPNIGQCWTLKSSISLVLSLQFSGPVFTIMTAVLGFVLLVKRKDWGYTLIFVAWFMRILAAVLSTISRYNDEARFSVFVGLEWWVVPAIVIGALTGLLVYASFKYAFDWTSNLFFFCTCSAGYALIGLIDGRFPGFSHPSPILLP